VGGGVDGGEEGWGGEMVAEKGKEEERKEKKKVTFDVRTTCGENSEILRKMVGNFKENGRL